MLENGRERESADWLNLPFTEQWTITDTLGEGAYGDVKLLTSRSGGESVAMKIVNLNAFPECLANTKKEICILRMLSHKNVIRFVGQRHVKNAYYVFLEYASGGELFDRIEPDIGMKEKDAQFLFRQLIDGVEYIHSKGVAHRDIKPENLLLTNNDILKISDFGLATLFRNSKGVERLLSTKCGTLPYVAPEVLIRDYHAEPADIWSCGVVLVAMLTGELPWDAPRNECERFLEWKECRSWRCHPWKKIDNVALSLLRAILTCASETRATISRIREHQWFTKDFSVKSQKQHFMDIIHGNPLAKRLKVEGRGLKDANIGCLSQPDTSTFQSIWDTSSSTTCTLSVARICQEFKMSLSTSPVSGMRSDLSFDFSQPAKLDSLLLCSQLSQKGANPVENLVKRMTRFVVKMNFGTALKKITEICTNLGMVVQTSHLYQLTVHTFDCRRTPLIFKVTVFEMGRNVLVDCRRSKGDGIDFKRNFINLKEALSDYIDSGASEIFFNRKAMETVHKEF